MEQRCEDNEAEDHRLKASEKEFREKRERRKVEKRKGKTKKQSFRNIGRDSKDRKRFTEIGVMVLDLRKLDNGMVE